MLVPKHRDPTIPVRPQKAIEAKRILSTQYHVLYNRLHRLDCCNDIGQLSTFAFYCNLYHIDFRKIKQVILDFMDCSLTDKQKELFDKKLKNYHSTPKKHKKKNKTKNY